ncbi:MAG: 3-hydroxyacyl-CoA dehydrogenase NAD-binding domain-containing protein, partial [Spirochaetota bacterium]
MIETVGILGAGQMGNGIAHVFALAGCGVVLHDIARAQLENSLITIRENLGRQVKKGAIAPSAVEETIARISIDEDIGALARVDFVVEAVTENEALKLALFRKLDATVKPEAVLATNTSSISVTKIAATTGRADRVIGMHFMNPVPVMKLVEVIRGHETSEATFATTATLVARLGKEMAVSQDYPGFIANRILMPMINE